MNAFSSSQRSRSAAFTLLEMMIAMAVFLLLTAAVFGMITGVLETTSTLTDNQNRRDQIMSLNAFMTTQLRDLSPRGSLISYQRGSGDGLKLNGIIWGEAGSAQVLDAKIQPNGLYLLRLASAGRGDIPEGSADTPLTLLARLASSDDSSLTWTPLVRDVKTVEWKFKDLNATDWLEQWPNRGAKPMWMEFTMQIAGELHPALMDFWIPPVVNVSSAAPAK